MTNYKYDEFWSRMGDRYAGEDPLGAVCWDGAPVWFNRFFARFQVREVSAALTAQLGSGRREGIALDLGCGTGRWTRWLDRAWTRPIGVDISRGMLRATDAQHGYLQTDVTRLPFGDATCDFVLSVTVLLHLPHDAQTQAIREVHRVLRAGGSFLMLEMVNRVSDRGHVFPNSIERWSQMLRNSGLEVERVRGEAFAPLLRAAFGGAARLSRGRGNAGGTDDMKAKDDALHSSAIAALPGPALAALRSVVAASYPVEYVAASLLPAKTALNACIVAKKRS